MSPLGLASDPGSAEWTLRNPRTGEIRTYEQVELTIEGETRLVSLAQKLAVAVREAGMDWQQLESLFDDGPFKWDLALDALGTAARFAPDLIADAACVMLGVFPVDEDGNRNEKYEDERRYIRSSIKLAVFFEMLQVLGRQNDWRRLLAPFSQVLGQDLGAPANKTQVEGDVGLTESQLAELRFEGELDEDGKTSSEPVPPAPQRRRRASKTATTSAS